MGEKPARLRESSMSPASIKKHTPVFFATEVLWAVPYTATADWYRGKGPDGEVEIRNNKTASPPIYLAGPCSPIRNRRSVRGLFKHQTRFCLPR